MRSSMLACWSSSFKSLDFTCRRTPLAFFMKSSVRSLARSAGVSQSFCTDVYRVAGRGDRCVGGVLTGVGSKTLPPLCLRKRSSLGCLRGATRCERKPTTRLDRFSLLVEALMKREGTTAAAEPAVYRTVVQSLQSRRPRVILRDPPHRRAAVVAPDR